MSNSSLAIVGGGWAGLAAAIEATRRGHDVTLFEMAPAPGGRARSVDTGEPVLDNGQHILIGAYRETLRLMREIDVDPHAAFLRCPLALVDSQGTGLRLARGPAVPAFALGVLSHTGWKWRERVALLTKALKWAAAGFDCDSSLTVGELCRALPTSVLRDLIEPLCVAALNTPSMHASGRVFLRVLRDAMFSGRGSADLLLPRQPLGDLLPAPAARWLTQQGAQVLTSRRVMAIDPDGAGWRVDDIHFDGVVLACTASEAARLAQPHAPQWADLAASFRYEPIVTVYALCAGTRLPQPMTLLHSSGNDGPAQFVFDHGWLNGQHGLFSFVISAAQHWVDAGSEATAEATFDQARRQLGAHLKAKLQTLRVFNEKRATFRCTPDLHRPPQRIAQGLLAAGDYVEGPYPSTLEGAVQSGLSAAREWRA